LETIDSGKIKWIDISQPTSAELEMLALKYPFHQLNLEDCLSRIQISKIDKHQSHSFIILRFPSISGHKSALSITVDQLSVFIGQDYLVTVHHAEFGPLAQLFQSCRNDKNLMGQSTGFLLYKIIDGLVDELLSTLGHIERDLDAIEDAVFGGWSPVSIKITTLRREIMTLKRTIIPLRRAIAELSTDIERFSNGLDLAPYFSDVKDHIEKVLEELEASKETVEIYKDTNFTTSTERSNKILGLLTILFTLTIPVTVLSSFYGMNIEIPGTVQSGPWDFFGPYTTMMLVIAASVAPSLVMLWYFYHKKWMSF
jgi:magnesium transporter